MAKVLYITANPKTPDNSYCLAVGDAFVKAYKQECPQDEVIELDLFNTYVPDIDEDVFSGWGKLGQGESFDSLSKEEQKKIGQLNNLLDQFIEADKYVFVTPMWNLGFPAVVKAYIDAICISGKTFRYTENGPVGLLSDKKAVHIQARGGIYSEGPMAELEFGDKFLRSILAFIGIPYIESIIVEGMAQTASEADRIKEEAITLAKREAVEFAKDLVKN